MARDPKAIRPIPVPTQPAGIASYGSILTEADLGLLIAEVKLPLLGDGAALIRQADSACLDFVLTAAATEWSTAGASAAWARETEYRAQALLACFTTAEAGDPLEQASRLLRGPSGYLEGLDYLPAAELRGILQTVALFAVRAGRAGSGFEGQKAQLRSAAEEEKTLFRLLAQVYVEAFGRPVGSGEGRTGRGGPAIRYYGYIGRRIAAYVGNQQATGRGDKIQSAIRRLTTPGQCADRIRSLAC